MILETYDDQCNYCRGRRHRRTARPLLSEGGNRACRNRGIERRTPGTDCRAIRLSGICGQDYSLARPDYARIYYARHETGGGAIQDVLTHFVNTMDWLVGPARDVQCLVGNRKLRDVSVEDTVCCSIRHEGGCLAGYYVCQGQAPEETSLTVHCENGSVRADLSQQRVGEFRPGDAEWTWTQFGPAERDEIYVRQAKAFLDATTGIPDQACTLGEAVHSLNVNIAALESARSGRCITV